MKEKRFLHRKKLTVAENITLSFTFNGKNKNKVKVVDITPLGCKIFFPEDMATGSSLTHIELYFNRYKMGGFSKATIVSTHKISNQSFYGLRFENPINNRIDYTDLRKQNRHPVNIDITPNGYFSNPNTPNEQINFEITDISRDGFCIDTSARNKFIFPNNDLILFHITFPSNSKAIDIKGRIKHISQAKKGNRLNVGVEFGPSDNSLFLIATGTYFVSFSKDKYLNKTLLEDFKFKKNIKKSFTYSVCDSEDDYQKVLEIRKKSYTENSKVDPGQDINYFSDDLDSKSYIVIVKRGSQLVASVRLTPRGLAKRFELDDYIPLHENLKNNNVVEASRACVDVEFRKSNLIHGMFEYLTLLALQIGARHIITSCEKHRIKSYKYLGFKKNGQSYYFKKFNSKKHYVLVGDLDSIRFAKKMNPIYWYYTYGDLIKYLDKFGLTESKKMKTWKKIIIWVLNKSK